MSNRKFQEDIRRIVGMTDGGRVLDDQQEREDILSSRGVAYKNASGSISSGNSVPEDVEEDQADDAENGDGSDPANADGGTTRNNQYCADGSLRPYSTGVCPEDTEAGATNFDDLGTSVTNGTTVPTVTGLYDCTTGDAVRISFDADGIAPETAPDTSDPNNLNNLITDPDTGLPVLNDNGEAQFNGEQDSNACIPPPNWQSCDCYQPEKRGGLKDGWDSVQMWHEAVNCADDPYFEQDIYWQVSSNSVNWGYTQTQIASPSEALAYVDANPTATIGATHYTFTGMQPWSNVSLGQYGYKFCYIRTYIGGDSCYASWTIYRQTCSSYAPEYCLEAAPQVCDQYPEQCENGNTDDESCMPLEIVKEEMCCEPIEGSDPFIFFYARHVSGNAFVPGETIAEGIFASFDAANAAIGNPYPSEGVYANTGLSAVDFYNTYSLPDGFECSALWHTNTSYSNYKEIKMSRSLNGATGGCDPLEAAEIGREGYGVEPRGDCVISDGVKDYTVGNGGIEPNPSDADSASDSTAAEKTFCDGNGGNVRVVKGADGGTLFVKVNGDGSVKDVPHYYRDKDGKMSFFDRTQISAYLPHETDTSG